MRFLRVLRLVLVDTRIGRQVVGVVAPLDRVPRGGHRLRGHVDPVRSHIGNVSRLVEALGDLHRLARAEPKLSAGFLLQGRGHERRRGVPRRGLRLDRPDCEVPAFDGTHGQFGGGLVRDIELVELLAAQHRQPRLELLPARRREDGLDRPVLLRVERLDLHLALDDEPQANRLHAARRSRARQLPPEDRRQVEPDKIIQRSPGQIGFDQISVDLARMLHRLGHGGFGDRVEHHPAHRRVLFQSLSVSERLFKMPRDRFALAIGVGGKDQGGIILQRVGDGLDVLFRVACDLPLHLEVVLGIDRSVLRRQVPYVTIACQNCIVRAEILVDCLGLSRRFDNDDWHENPFENCSTIAALNVGWGGLLSTGARHRVADCLSRAGSEARRNPAKPARRVPCPSGRQRPPAPARRYPG